MHLPKLPQHTCAAAIESRSLVGCYSSRARSAHAAANRIRAWVPGAVGRAEVRAPGNRAPLAKAESAEVRGAAEVRR